ncbi:hypothetical protein [Jannaschia sp. W003]|uniref:hypothetical protein n=1 Tax=Jannaschia sp. W003 TaxID=2867012 RepID=UPI0021A279F6|nr:hypothetical protein [Jannaschia sp. W003]UWQ20760.1 hypothetical protein K3554_12345 [Jannaschia sp. W003]
MIRAGRLAGFALAPRRGGTYGAADDEGRSASLVKSDGVRKVAFAAFAVLVALAGAGVLDGSGL